MKEPAQIVAEPAASDPPAAVEEVRVAAPLTPARVRGFAARCETMAEAEELLGVEDLTGRLAANERLRAAWDRGRRLRDIRAIAVTPICLEEASKRLGMGDSGLAQLYRRDAEVRDVWDRGKVDMLIRLKEALMTRAQSGNTGALRTVEKVLAGEFAAGGQAAVDFARLTPTQMAAATGVHRQQIDRWFNRHGLPRNGDGTFSLPAFLAWYAEFTRAKVARTGGPGRDPLREQKARSARVAADLAEGRVIEKAAHLRILMTQAAWLVQLLSADKAEEWAALHEGRTAAQLKQSYLDAFEALRRQWCACPAELALPAAARAKFEEGFQALKEITTDE